LPPLKGPGRGSCEPLLLLLLLFARPMPPPPLPPSPPPLSRSRFFLRNFCFVLRQVQQLCFFVFQTEKTPREKEVGEKRNE
jgi:hypothetical protein